MMGIGLAMMVGGGLWLWLAPKFAPLSVEGIPESVDPVFGMGTIFIGLIVAAVGASTYE